MVEIRKPIFLFPFITFFVYQAIKLSGVNVDLFIRQEGVLDSLQFPIYLLSAFLVFDLVKRVNKNNKLILSLIGLLILFVAFEEISWGQHFLKFQNNNFFSNNNLQNEFNLHNLSDVQNFTHLDYILVGIVFSIKFIIVKIMIVKSKFLLLFPGLKYVGYNLPIALYYFIFFYTPYQSKIINYVGQEYFEFMFSLGLLLFIHDSRSLLLANKMNV